MAAEDGLLEEALDEPVLVHPPNGPSSALDGRRSFDTLNFLSQRGEFQLTESYIGTNGNWIPLEISGMTCCFRWKKRITINFPEISLKKGRVLVAV